MAKKEASEDFELFDIDENNLVEEWKNQPKYYIRYAMKLADARRDLEQSKADLELTKAELDSDIRECPDDYDLAKITEAAIAATIITTKKYKAKFAEHLEVKRKVDTLQAFVTALDHRKRALENLVDLHGQQYYSTPRGESEGMKEAGKKASRRFGRRSEDGDDD